MKKKVKLFTGISSDVQSQINGWLANNEETREIIDIKYSFSGEGKHSVLIYYSIS